MATPGQAGFALLLDDDGKPTILVPCNLNDKGRRPREMNDLAVPPVERRVKYWCNQEESLITIRDRYLPPPPPPTP